MESITLNKSPRIDIPLTEGERELQQALRQKPLANSEDIVPTVPPATFRLVGEEMLPGPLIEQIGEFLSGLSAGVAADSNEHIGMERRCRASRSSPRETDLLKYTPVNSRRDVDFRTILRSGRWRYRCLTGCFTCFSEAPSS